jgi:hypothetical protein
MPGVADPVAQRIAIHRSASWSHELAAERHARAEQFWLERGEREWAELERRDAAIERSAATLERDRAALTERQWLRGLVRRPAGG